MFLGLCKYFLVFFYFKLLQFFLKQFSQLSVFFIAKYILLLQICIEFGSAIVLLDHVSVYQLHFSSKLCYIDIVNYFNILTACVVRLQKDSAQSSLCIEKQT